MNERIKELALQCGAWHQVYDQKLLKINEYFNYEKYAKLIIEECCKIADSEKPNYLGCGYVTKTKGMLIKENFGIKE